MFIETNPLFATPQAETDIVAGIQTAYAADRFAQRQQARRQPRRARLQISADELDRMVKDFAATRGGIVMCPPAYVLPSEQYHN